MAASKRPDNAAPRTRVVARTDFGKEIEIKRTRDGQFFEIGFVGGGEKPKEFEGRFTSHVLANQAVELYKSRKGI